MSFEITTAFVQQYGSTVQHLAQQKGSRLRQAVDVETGIAGKTSYFDQVGTVAAQKVTTRHADSPLNPTPHARRRVSLWDYDTGDLVDKPDLIRTLIDPTNAYTVAHGNAMGRACDDEIIAAAFGTAYTGEDGSTAVTSGWHTVAATSWAYGTGTGATGLTISKLIEAKVKLWGAEATEDGDPLWFVCSNIQLGNLLQTTEATSADYNTVKALVNGEIHSFMGFNFIRTQRLPVDGSGYRRCIAMTTRAIKLGIGADITPRIAERSDKRFSMYVYFNMTIGATRMQEVEMAEVICSES